MITRATRTDADGATSATLHRGHWLIGWRRFRRNATAVGGGIILLIAIFCAVFAPELAPRDPNLPDFSSRFRPPSLAHPFGTDDLGRDLLSRVITGSRLTLQVGVISVTVAMLVGVSVGLVAGYYGGLVDGILMRIIDVLLAFPGILLALVVVATLGPGLRNVMIAVGVFSIPSYARVVRSSTLSVREQEFVEAMRALGASDFRIAVRHIFPNVLAPVIVLATLGVGTAILSAAGLSFVGLGAQPPSPEWGAMLSQARSYLRNEWWMATFPGLAILVTVLAINLAGDGLRDALDPRLRV